MKVFYSLMFLFMLARMAGAQAPDDIAQRILVLSNAARQKSGVSPLADCPRLKQIALYHCLEMDRLGYFSHHSPVLRHASLLQRMREEREFSLSCGENLHRNEGYEARQVAQLAVDSWLASPGHRKNLLNPRYSHVGISVTKKGDQYTITQNFAYKAVEVISSEIKEGDSGREVRLLCKVEAGPCSGAIFYEGRRCADWRADARHEFEVSFMLPAEKSAGWGELGVGQEDDGTHWIVETEFPLRLNPPGPAPSVVQSSVATAAKLPSTSAGAPGQAHLSGPKLAARRELRR